MIDQRASYALARITAGDTMTPALKAVGLTKREFIVMAKASPELRQRWWQACEDAALVGYWRAQPRALLNILK